MNRSQFIKNAIGVILASVGLSKIDNTDKNYIEIKGLPQDQKKAIRDSSVTGIKYGGRELTPKEVIKLYKETGVLLIRLNHELPEIL